MQSNIKTFQQCRQCAVARPRRPFRSLRCFAKRKGEQKNEGMYFVYQDTSKQRDSAGSKPSEKQKQDFSWVGSARSSVQQYKQSLNGRPSKPKQQQQRQQKPQREQIQQEHVAASEPQSQQERLVDAAGVLPAGQSSAAAAAEVAPESAAQQPQPMPSEASDISSNSNQASTQPQRAPVSSSSSSSSKQDVLIQRKQQLLQRMKGSAAAISPTPSAAAVIGATAAAATAAASAAATEEDSTTALDMSATAGAADGVVPGLDAEGESLLQELLDMAQQLSDPGYNTVIDNDPSADPLADVMPDYEPSSGSSSSSSEISLADLSAAAAGGDAEAAEWFAAITELQKMQTAAAAAAAADGDSSSGVLRAADLLNWEAEEAARSNKVTDLDVDAELAATQRSDYGEVPDGEDEDEDEWEYIEDDEDRDEYDESSYDNDPEVQQLLAEDEAEFARMLAQLNGMNDDSEDGSSSSSTAAAAAADESDSWQGMQPEDWLAAVSDHNDDLDQDDQAVISNDLSDASLSDVLSAIESDRALDDKAKLEARLRIQGMFNDPATAAAGRSRRGSKGMKQQTADVDQPALKSSAGTSAAAAAAGSSADGDGDKDASEQPVLMPKPVWRPQ